MVRMDYGIMGNYPEDSGNTQKEPEQDFYALPRIGIWGETNGDLSHVVLMDKERDSKEWEMEKKDYRIRDLVV